MFNEKIKIMSNFSEVTEQELLIHGNVETALAERQVVENLLAKYGLDFDIEKLPMFGKRVVSVITDSGMENQEVFINSDDYGLLNTKSGEIINTVKKGYTVSQTKEVMSLVRQGTSKFPNVSLVNGYSLNGGRKTMFQLKVDGFSKVGNDKITKYITVLDSNDGSTSLSVGIGDFTLSCKNQFYHFYKQGQSRFRHSRNLQQKINEIPHLIEVALNESMKMIELYREFESTPITMDLAHQLVNHLLSYDRTTIDVDELKPRALNNMNALYANIEHEISTENKGMNLWGLHSGVTRWTTHDKQAPNRPNGRLEGIIAGTNYKTNQKSLEFAKKVLAG